MILITILNKGGCSAIHVDDDYEKPVGQILVEDHMVPDCDPLFWKVEGDVVSEDLDLYRAKFWKEVQDYRASQIYSNITYLDNTFLIDTEAIKALEESKEELTLNNITELRWSTVETNNLILTLADVSNLLTMFRARKQNLFTVSWDIQDFLEDVEDSDILSGFNAVEEFNTRFEEL